MKSNEYMNTTFKKENDIGHLYFSGDMDLVSREAIYKAVQDVVDECTKIVFHLDDVEYIDSSGLTSMYRAAKMLISQNKPFSILGANDRIKNLFKLTNFEDFIKKGSADNIVE